MNVSDIDDATGVLVKTKYVLQTRRKNVGREDYTSWRDVFISNLEDALKEREAYVISGYKPDNLRLLKREIREIVMIAR